jgi:hypothetical protein
VPSLHIPQCCIDQRSLPGYRLVRPRSSQSNRMLQDAAISTVSGIISKDPFLSTIVRRYREHLCNGLICSSNNRPLPASYYRLIAATLATLTNVRSLELHLSTSDYLSILESASFPCMTRFVCTLPFTPELALFLNRHPSLRELDLLPLDLSSDSAALPAVELHGLKNVRTVIETLPTILALSPNVELLFLQHSSPKPNERQLVSDVDAIARLAPNLRALQVTRPVLGLEFAAVISTRLCKLETLAIYRPRPRSACHLEYEMVCTLDALFPLSPLNQTSTPRTLSRAWRSTYPTSDPSRICRCNTATTVADGSD